MVLAASRCLAPEVVEVGGAVVMRWPQAPGVSMLNRAIGLGVDHPASEEDVDAVLGALAGTRFYVAVAPEAGPPALAGWLEARGLVPGWGWMLFGRDLDDPPAARSALRPVEVESREQAEVFARIVCVGFELPQTLEPVLARAPETGWLCWLCLDGDEPAAAAGMYVAEGAAYLSFAATLPEHRGKGGQSALLAARLRRAGELGCDLALTETGELRDGLPSNSYRNILRGGFHEIAVTANWLGQR